MPNKSFKPRPLRGSANAVSCTTSPSRCAVRLNTGVRRSMIQTRPGDLIQVQKDGVNFTFCVLTKKLLFGGNWCFVCYNSDASVKDGFNAFVDFLVPKRENRITKLSSGNDFSHLHGSELLKQQPTRGKTMYHIYRWRELSISTVSSVRSTESPTKVERSAPEYASVPADWACELAELHWSPDQSLWIA